jgi:hypothetical protein
VEIDRALVHRRVRLLALDDAEDRARAGFDDREDVRARRAQAEAPGGIVATRPDVAGFGALQLRVLSGAAQCLGAEDVGVVVVERRLEGGCGDVPVEDARVLVVQDGRLDAAVEQHLRLAHEVLVEGVIGGDEDG